MDSQEVGFQNDSHLLWARKTPTEMAGDKVPINDSSAKSECKTKMGGSKTST